MKEQLLYLRGTPWPNSRWFLEKHNIIEWINTFSYHSIYLHQIFWCIYQYVGQIHSVFWTSHFNKSDSLLVINIESRGFLYQFSLSRLKNTSNKQKAVLISNILPSIEFKRISMFWFVNLAVFSINMMYFTYFKNSTL